MARYNQLDEVVYNDLGTAKYNDFHQVTPDPFYHRLPGARPVVLSQDKKQLCVLENAYNLIMTQEKNGTDVLDFDLPFDDSKSEYLVNENFIQLTDDEFVIRTVTKSRDENGEKTISVYAEATWYDLQYADPIQSGDWSDVTPDVPISDLLTGTGWSAGTVKISTLRNMNVDPGTTNRLEALKQVPDLWGGSLVFHTKDKKVDLIDGSLGDPGTSIVYQKNMKSMKAEYDTRDLITRLYPYGKNGLTIEDANNYVPYVENYQYAKQVRVRSFQDSRFTNPYHLKDQAESILDKLSVPRSSYQTKAADLSTMTGLEHEVFKLGYMVRVYDKELGVSLKTEIVKWKYNVIEPWKTELELSSVQPGLEDLLKNVVGAGSYLQSEDTVQKQDMLNLMVYNYLLNSRAESGEAYWVNNGWEIDSQNGYSGPASFKCIGEQGVEKTLTQTVNPSHRDSYTISFRANSSNLSLGSNGQAGVEVTIKYEDGTSSSEFLPLA